jgi:hypothetical protein
LEHDESSEEPSEEYPIENMDPKKSLIFDRRNLEFVEILIRGQTVRRKFYTRVVLTY